MSLTQDEAAQSLASAEEIQRRSREAFGYSRSSPYLLTLGAFWTLCYGATQFWPQHSAWIWGIGTVVFGFAMTWLSYRSRQGTQNARSREMNRNIGIMFGVIIPAFAVASIAVMWPVYGLKIGAFLPLLYAALYTGMGLWLGRRYVIVGITVFVATLIGFYFVREYFALWMAAFGGGSMILTGLWLRKA
jgi:hypothetical protein